MVPNKETTVVQKKEQKVKAACYDYSSLTGRVISNEYTVTVRHKFDTLQKTSGIYTSNYESENFATIKKQWQCAYKDNQVPVVLDKKYLKLYDYEQIICIGEENLISYISAPKKI